MREVTVDSQPRIGIEIRNIVRRPRGTCYFTHRPICISEYSLIISISPTSTYEIDSKNTESTVGQDDQQHHAVATALKMPEILENIFKFLALPPSKDLINAALVNKKWRDASYSPSLWKEYTASIVLQPLHTVQLLPSLTRRRLRRIELKGLKTHMRDLLPSLPFLKYLSFNPSESHSDSEMTDKVLRVALRQQHTALAGFCLYGCQKITDASVILLSSRLPNLKSLSLCYCPLVTDAGLLAVARSFPLLSSLAVNYTAITDAGVAVLAGRTPEMAPGLPNIHTLNLAGCGITDTALLHVSVGFPKLEMLFLYECPKLTDAGLGHLVTPVEMGILLYVDVDGSTGITEEGLKQLPKLQELIYV